MAAQKRTSRSVRKRKPAGTAWGLSHVGPTGALRMVDVSAKGATVRMALARAMVTVGPAVARLLKQSGAVVKGNVFEAARLAGILGAKRVDELIPLCHSLPLDAVRIDFHLQGPRVQIEAEARTTARTGVEMEALTAATLAALTIYDMCKAVTKGIVIGPIELVRKTGGKSGAWELRRGRGRGPRR